MKHTVVGIFSDSKHAGEAVGELNKLGYSKDISVVAKDVNAQGIEAHTVKNDLPDQAAKGAGTGAVLGGVVGAIAGLLAGAASITVPVVGIAAVGPIVAALTGAGAGGAAGTVLGAMTGMGIPNDRAKEYEKYIESGQILVAVSCEPEDADKISSVLETHIQQQDNRLDGMDYDVYRYQY